MPGASLPTLPDAAEDLTGDEVRGGVGDDPAEGHGSVEQVVLVAAVALTLAVGVVLVDDDLLARRHQGSSRARIDRSMISSPARS